MNPLLPDPEAFDPVREGAPDAAMAALTESRLAVLAVTAEAGSWASEAATALLRRASSPNSPTVAVDLSLDRPGLGLHLGVAGGEGIVDHFIFGTSLARIIRSAPGLDEGVRLIPPGSPTADPGAILAHRGWDRLVGRFRDAEVRLVLYVPRGLERAEELVRRGETLVLLGPEGEAFASSGGEVTAWLVPSEGGESPFAEIDRAASEVARTSSEWEAPPPPSDVEGPSGEVERSEARVTEGPEAPDPEGEGEDLPGRGDPVGGEEAPEPEGLEDLGIELVTGPDFGPGEEFGAEGAGAGDEPGEDGEGRRREEGLREEEEQEDVEGRAAEEGRRAEEPVVETGSSKAGHRDETRSGDRSGSPGAPPKSRLAPLLLLTLLLAAGVLAASGLGWIRIPIVDRALIPLLGPARAGVAPAVTHPEPVPESPLLGYSLTIDVYRDAASAGEVAQALGQRLPGLHFVIAPVSVDGQVLYRLLAGPATTARLPLLRAALATAGPPVTQMRSTPLEAHNELKDSRLGSSIIVTKLLIPTCLSISRERDRSPEDEGAGGRFRNPHLHPPCEVPRRRGALPRLCGSL